MFFRYNDRKNEQMLHEVTGGLSKSGKTLSFWQASLNLESEEFKKPSAKRLSKRGQKLNDKLYKNEKK